MYTDITLASLQLSINSEKQRCEALENELRKMTAEKASLLRTLKTPHAKGKPKYSTMRPGTVGGKPSMTGGYDPEVFRRMLEPILADSPARAHHEHDGGASATHAMQGAVPPIQAHGEASSNTPPRLSAGSASDGSTGVGLEGGSGGGVGGGSDRLGIAQGERRSVDLVHLTMEEAGVSIHGVEGYYDSAATTPVARLGPSRHPSSLEIGVCGQISIPSTPAQPGQAAQPAPSPVHSTPRGAGAQLPSGDGFSDDGSSDEPTNSAFSSPRLRVEPGQTGSFLWLPPLWCWQEAPTLVNHPFAVVVRADVQSPRGHPTVASAAPPLPSPPIARASIDADGSLTYSVDSRAGRAFSWDDPSVSPPTPLVLSHVLQWAQKDMGLSLTAGIDLDPRALSPRNKDAVREALSRVTNCCSRLSTIIDLSLRKVRQMAADGLHGDGDEQGSPLVRLQSFITMVSSLLLLTLSATPSTCVEAMHLSAKRSTGVGDGTGSSSSSSSHAASFDGNAPVHANVVNGNPEKVAASLFRIAVASVVQGAEAWPHALNITSQMMVCNQPFAPKWVPDEHRGACAHCSKAFSVTLRRHHCRACGDLFCKPCWYVGLVGGGGGLGTGRRDCAWDGVCACVCGCCWRRDEGAVAVGSRWQAVAWALVSISRRCCAVCLPSVWSRLRRVLAAPTCWTSIPSFLG